MISPRRFIASAPSVMAAAGFQFGRTVTGVRIYAAFPF